MLNNIGPGGLLLVAVVVLVLFGRGKVVQRVEPNKYKINFPGFGLKLIIEDFVELE